MKLLKEVTGDAKTSLMGCAEIKDLMHGQNALNEDIGCRKKQDVLKLKFSRHGGRCVEDMRTSSRKELVKSLVKSQSNDSRWSKNLQLLT